MRKIVSSLFVFMLAVSLVLIPAPALAQDDGCYGTLPNCEWDPVKWESNADSWHLYLQHWGRTPVTAMSRLAGGGYPASLMTQTPEAYDCHWVSPSNQGDKWCTQWGSTNSGGAGCAQCRAEEAGFCAGCSDPIECTDSLTDAACSALAVPDSECIEDPVYMRASCGVCWGNSLAFANKSWAGCDISPHPRWNNCHPNHFGNSAGGAENWGGDWGLSGAPHTDCISQCWAFQDNLCQDFDKGCFVGTSDANCPCQGGMSMDRFYCPDAIPLDWCPLCGTCQ